MNTPVRVGETIEGSRTMGGIDPIKCSSAQVLKYTLTAFMEKSQKIFNFISCP